MKVLAIALTVYCLAAILAIAGAGVYFGLDLARLHAELPAAQQQRTDTARARESTHRDYIQLAEQQQAERLNYTGEEAIRMSHRVQQAQAAFTQASTAAQIAAAAAGELEGRISHRQLQYVPLGGLLLLHVIGLLIFWPWRERRSPKPAD